ncbi:ABC-3 protein [Methanothermus fervidus DSM 2088]|uniref:ABC-3 protein n=1 Tax=Methanothermus fervidus (strain ATCC 43054 / DSM 2088 / JCM 10308 / V24 S) TaxID=523846 RepID=E3GWX4_METFV|nr:metal ABC transporter permease [Methanothermus fervidus]ADP76863.1 ABC-3 protein [Methanothermus fervidus DSM 2088]
MFSVIQCQFMQNAIIGAFLAGIACGIIGTYVVVKRIVFIAGGISHAAFGGIGLGYFLNLNPILTSLPFTSVLATMMGIIVEKSDVSEDVVIGILWAVGMAIGILFVNLTPGYVSGLFTYLFGNILMISKSDLILMTILDTIILTTVFLFNKEFTAISFDEEYAEALGVPTTIFYLFLLNLVAISIIMIIKAMGIILTIALLTIPAAIGKKYTSRIESMMKIAAFIAIISSLIGLELSYLLNLSSGATIVLVLAILFIITHITKEK